MSHSSVSEAVRGAVSEPSAGRQRAGAISLLLAIVAASASVVCSIVVGLNLGPVQARLAGPDAASSDQTTEFVLIGLLFTNVLWTILGVAALVLGIVAARRQADRKRGIAAIIVSVMAPGVSFFTWLTLTLLTSPLG